MITGSLDELRSAKHAPRQSSSDEFVVADWIPRLHPRWLPAGLHHCIVLGPNITAELIIIWTCILHLIRFNFTSSTTYPDLWDGGGLFYAMQPNNSDKYDSYENIRESIGHLANPVSITNQTNGYFGLQNRTRVRRFSVLAAFETQKIHIVTRADVPHAEGTKMINSIQGVLLPE